jgi:hypothetical protein
MPKRVGVGKKGKKKKEGGSRTRGGNTKGVSIFGSALRFPFFFSESPSILMVIACSSSSSSFSVLATSTAVMCMSRGSCGVRKLSSAGYSGSGSIESGGSSIEPLSALHKNSLGILSLADRLRRRLEPAALMLDVEAVDCVAEGAESGPSCDFENCPVLSNPGLCLNSRTIFTSDQCNGSVGCSYFDAKATSGRRGEPEESSTLDLSWRRAKMEDRPCVWRKMVS